MSPFLRISESVLNLYNLQILYKIIKDNISEALFYFILYYKQFVKKNMSWELTKCVHSYLNVSNRCRYTMQSIFIASNVAAWVKIFAKTAVSLWKYSPLCLKKGSTHGHSFLVSNQSDLLTSLIFGERPEKFAHIADQKRGNEQIAHFLNKKMYIKHTKKIRF